MQFSKQEYPPFDYDSVIDRKNDIMDHDRTKFDVNVSLVGDSKLIFWATYFPHSSILLFIAFIAYFYGASYC